jgi:FkbM family methyltransferase
MGLRDAMEYGRISYAQEGEDVLLWAMLGGQHYSGTYVEVGCNHPIKCSNTAFLYERGWTGVAIDPNPDFAELFLSKRPKDTFVNVGIGRPGLLTYYRFNEALLNTFSRAKAQEYERNPQYHIVGTQRVEIVALAQCLSSIWPDGNQIDFLSVDAEGMDLEVLKSHDYERFPVSFICAEIDSPTLAQAMSEPLVALLGERGFVLVCKTLKSALFVNHREVKRFGVPTTR